MKVLGLVLTAIGLLGSSSLYAQQMAMKFAQALQQGDSETLSQIIKLPTTLCVGDQWQNITQADELREINWDSVLTNKAQLIEVLQQQTTGNPYGSVRPMAVHQERFYETDGELVYLDDNGISRIIPKNYYKCAPPVIDLCKDPAQNAKISAALHKNLLLGLNLFELPRMAQRAKVKYDSNVDYKILGYFLPFSAEDFVNENLPKRLNQITINYDPQSYLAGPMWSYNRGRSHLMIQPYALSELNAVRGCTGDDYEQCNLPNAYAHQYQDELFAYRSVLMVQQEKNGTCSLVNFYPRELFPETVADHLPQLREEMEDFAPHGQARLNIVSDKWVETKDPKIRFTRKDGRFKLHYHGHNYNFETNAALGWPKYYGNVVDPAGRGPYDWFGAYFVPVNRSEPNSSDANEILMVIYNSHKVRETLQVLHFKIMP